MIFKSRNESSKKHMFMLNTAIISARVQSLASVTLVRASSVSRAAVFLCSYPRNQLLALFQVRTWARTDNLAQASHARLSETGRGSPRPSARTVAQAGGMDELKWDSTRNVNEELVKKGETSRSYFSGRDVIPWPLLVGAYDGVPSLGGEQLRGEQRYPPQVQASAESDQVIRIRMSRVVS
ncbi:hypothetical protein DEO72_LG2g3588 [Vigna unguiculata]|uniref:Uncharacterized protein n=1 Tax=Vigna unguiculata TaxID=3917 RepID=A0A4D6L466_VIGUN|nr:hypothetical protein DEO72_LG2g3588 [Vigna unguiculata]